MCQVKFNENIFTLNCFLELYTIFFSIMTHYRAATAGKAPKVWALHSITTSQKELG